MGKIFGVGVLSFFILSFFSIAYAGMMEYGDMPIDFYENGYGPSDYPAVPKAMMGGDTFNMGYRHGMMFGGMGVSLMWLFYFSIIVWLGVGILLFLFLWGKVFKK